MRSGKIRNELTPIINPNKWTSHSIDGTVWLNARLKWWLMNDQILPRKLIMSWNSSIKLIEPKLLKRLDILMINFNNSHLEINNSTQSHDGLSILRRKYKTACKQLPSISSLSSFPLLPLETDWLFIIFNKICGTFHCLFMSME